MLTIEPKSVVITGAGQQYGVTVTCRARPSVGPLDSLQLTRLSSVSNTSLTLVRAIADSVLDPARLNATVVSGGISQRFINYTFLQVHVLVRLKVTLCKLTGR